MSLQALSVQLSANAGPLVSELRKSASAVEQFDRQTTTSVKKIEASLQGGVNSTGKFGRATSSSLESVGLSAGAMKGAVVAGAAVAGAAMVQMARVSVAAASALNEQISATKTLFGDAATGVLDFAKSAEAIGMSERAALQAANAYGDFFTKLGYTQSAAATLSEDLVRVAADFASFKDLGTEDVLEKLRSGLAGESEPLRALGVFLTEAKVKAEGMKLGLADAHGELTEGEKITARYSLIVKEMGAAYGDAARTSDSYANQQRQMAAASENLQATIGQGLLPVLTDLSVIANKALGALNGKDGGGNWVDSIPVVGLLAEGVHKLAGALGSADEETNYLADTTEILANKQKYSKEQVQQATQSLADQRKAMDELTQATIAQFDSEIRYQQSLLGIREGLGQYNEALAKNRDGKADNDVSTNDMRKMQLGLRQDLLSAGNAAVKSAEDQAKAAGRTLSETEKWQVFRKALVDLGKQFPQLKVFIDEYIKRLGKVPPAVVTEAKIKGGQKAIDMLEGVYAAGLKAASPVNVSVTLSGAAAVNRVLTDLAGKSRSVGATIQGPGTNLLLPPGTLPTGKAAGGIFTPPSPLEDMLPLTAVGDFIVPSPVPREEPEVIEVLDELVPA